MSQDEQSARASGIGHGLRAVRERPNLDPGGRKRSITHRQPLPRGRRREEKINVQGPCHRRHPGQARPPAEVLEAFNANVPAVHAEDGCIEYGAAVDAEAGAIQTKYGEDTFVVVEKWASLDALRAHGASAHMAAYAAKVKDLLANRTIHVLTDA